MNIIREAAGLPVSGADPAGGATALASGSNTAAQSMPAAPPESAIEAAPLPFCCFIQPYSELAGFGSLRAEDILAAELLGSGRSIGRKDKAEAAAAFNRYAVRF